MRGSYSTVWSAMVVDPLDDSRGMRVVFTNPRGPGWYRVLKVRIDGNLRLVRVWGIGECQGFWWGVGMSGRVLEF